MSLIDNIANIFGLNQEEAKSSDIGKDIEKKLSNKAPIYRPDFIIDMPEPPARKSSDYLDAYKHYVMRCVSARSREVGNIKLHLYRRKGTDWTEVTEHALLNLIAKPNEYSTQSMFFENIQAYKDLSGEAFFWVLPDDNTGSPTEMWSLRPDWVDIKVGKEKMIDSVIFRQGGSGNPDHHIRIPFEDILYFKTFNPTNPYRGLSLVKAGASEIDSYDFATDFNRRFFYNSARPSGILTTETNLKEDTRRRLEEQWTNKYQGRENAFKTAILEGGLKWQDMTHNQKDMDFATLKTMSRDDILSIFQVPKTIIGITDDVNRANAKEARAVFQEFVIDPLMRDIVSFLNMFLVLKFGDDLFLDYEPPYPADTAQNLRYYESGIQNHWLSVNEVREKEGLDPIEDDRAESPLIPFNLIPIDSSYDENPEDPADDSSGDTTSDSTDDEKSMIKRKMHLTPPPRPIKEAITEKIKKRVIDSLSTKDKDTMKAVLKTMTKIPDFDLSTEEAQDSFAKAVEETKKEVKKKYKIAGFEYNGEFKEAYWKQFIERQSPYERLFKYKLRRLFVKQEAEVLSRLKKSDTGKSNTKGVGDIIFDSETESKLFADILVPILQDLIKETGKSTMDFLGVDRDFTENIQRVVNYLEGSGGTFIRSINDETKKQIIRELTVGERLGEGSDALADRVRKVYKEATQYRAERIARTETIRASNFATEEAYKQSNVVVKKEWLTSRDERVCEWCAPQDGKIIDLDDDYYKSGSSYKGLNGGILKFGAWDVNAPPLHPNCRCTLLPVTTDDEQTPSSFKNSQRVYDAFDFDGLSGVTQDERNTKAGEVFTRNIDWAGGIIDEFNWEVRLLNLKDDVVVHSWQDGASVDRYVQDMKNGAKFPPMLAIRDTVEEGKYTILDGAHRTEALGKLGAENIYLVATDPTKMKNNKSAIQNTKDSDTLVKSEFIPARARQLIEDARMDPEVANFRACLEFYIKFFNLEVTIPN